MAAKSIGETVVWISGASSGLGKAIAKAFVRAGYRVAAGARSFRDQEGTADEKGLKFFLDVTDGESVARFAEKATAALGAPDILINCAGILILGPYEEYTLDEIHRVMDTDFYGMVRMCQAVIAPMRENGGGRIVCLSSINGLLGIPYQGAYTAAKHAVEGFAECLSMEVRPFGIEVMLVEPGDHRSGSDAYRRHAQRAGDNPAYHPSFEHVTQTIEHDETHGSDPDRLGEKLAALMGRKHLPLRKRIASPDQKAAVLMHRLLPGRLFSRVIASYYHTYKKEAPPS